MPLERRLWRRRAWLKNWRSLHPGKNPEKMWFDRDLYIELCLIMSQNLGYNWILNFRVYACNSAIVFIIYIYIPLGVYILVFSRNPNGTDDLGALGTDYLPGRDHHDRTQKRLCGAHLQWTLADRGDVTKWAPAKNDPTKNMLKGELKVEVTRMWRYYR